ncbi:hypothetical protein LshimejAT787_1602290 [Lyophyllum shimeji]|uniref:Uncharacterized protein n=1 Tax=Lyophyllum shimeji TaxID=47721 RepID=A0A9P3PZ73_LYOSH|nr:hypothetical protein LshimejAT787_1602290 [Lyophyllum shimeji]
MASSPIVVGRMLVDADHADHADLASSLLSAQRALAGMEAAHPSKGKGRADDHTSDASLSDEEYALKIQKEFLQDTLRVMEDFRLARSLGAGGETVHQHSNIVDRTALDYLRVLLTTPATTSKLGSPPPQLTIADLRCTVALRSLMMPACLAKQRTAFGLWMSLRYPRTSPMKLLESIVSGSTSLASPHEPDSQPTEEDVELDEETAGEAPTGDIREILGNNSASLLFTA